MASLASLMQRIVGRPIVDKTGLKGDYILLLESATAGAPGGVAADPTVASTLPSVFTAVQEQLGLRLVSSRAPIQVLVVDHIERPTPN